jgi:hypothetical protein
VLCGAWTVTKGKKNRTPIHTDATAEAPLTKRFNSAVSHLPGLAV